MSNGYGYLDERPDPPPRKVPSGTPPSAVKQPPASQARGQTRQSKEGVLREIRDRQNPPVTRVIIGKLGDAPTDWGIQVFDQNGDLVLNASGEVGLVAGLLQDPTGKFKIDLDNLRITILDSSGTKRVEIGDLTSGTFGIQVWNAAGTKILDESGQIGSAMNRGGSGGLLNILQFILDGGKLDPNMTQQTSGTQRALARGTQTGKAADGDVVTFSAPFSQPPAVIIVPSGRIYKGSASASDQWIVMQANGLDESGFTMKAVIQERSSSSLVTDTFPTGTLTTDGDSLALGGLTDDAVDDEYTVEYTYDFSLTDGGSGSELTSSSATYTVHVDAKDGAGSWVEKSSKQYFLSASAGGTNSTSGTDTQSFSDANINGGDDIRVRLSISLSCGASGCSSTETVDPVDVAYNVATVTEHSMSPNGETLSFIAYEGL